MKKLLTLAALMTLSVPALAEPETSADALKQYKACRIIDQNKFDALVDRAIVEQRDGPSWYDNCSSLERQFIELEWEEYYEAIRETGENPPPCRRDREGGLICAQ